MIDCRPKNIEDKEINQKLINGTRKMENKKNNFLGTLVIGWSEVDTLFPKPKDIIYKQIYRGVPCPNFPTDKDNVWDFMNLIYIGGLLKDSLKEKNIEKIKQINSICLAELSKIIGNPYEINCETKWNEENSE